MDRRARARASSASGACLHAQPRQLGWLACRGAVDELLAQLGVHPVPARMGLPVSPVLAHAGALVRQQDLAHGAAAIFVQMAIDQYGPGDRRPLQPGRHRVHRAPGHDRRRRSLRAVLCAQCWRRRREGSVGSRRGLDGTRTARRRSAIALACVGRRSICGDVDNADRSVKVPCECLWARRWRNEKGEIQVRRNHGWWRQSRACWRTVERANTSRATSSATVTRCISAFDEVSTRPPP